MSKTQVGFMPLEFSSLLASNQKATQSSSRSVTQAGSTIASLNGDTTIVAGNHLQVTASDVAAANNVSLSAKSIDLSAAQNTTDEHNAQQSKSSGFSVGITVNPVDAFKSAYKATADNTPATGTVGKVTRLASAVGAGAKAATTGIVVTAGSKKSSAVQDHSTSTARTSSLTAGNNLTIIATDGSINSQGTQMSAEGDALLLAKDNINLDVAHNYESQNTDSKASGWGFDNRLTGLPIGVFNNKANGDGFTDTVTGTQLSVGRQATLATTQGDITLTGANVVAQNDLNINAARNLTIQSAQDTVTNENHSNNKAIGKVVISDTERFMGYHSEKHNDNADQVTQVSSNVASLGGNVNLTAGNKYTQTASNVVAANDINITGKTIDILTADNTGTSHSDDKSLKVGVFARVSSPIIDLVNNIDAARQSDGRLQAMQGMAVAANAYQVGSAIANQGTLISAEVGLGVKSAKSQQDSQYSNAQGSTINAGHNVNITSTEGDIHAVGAGITAGKALSLDSAKDILLESAQSTSQAAGSKSGFGAEVGVGVAVGAQTGVYAYAAVEASKGKSASDSTTNSNTHLVGETVNITSKGNTTLRGADARANTITADVGGQLAVESVQDTMTSMSKESGINARVQVSFGTAWSASGGVNQSKANGTYTGVNQQSGLFAGDGGYHVKADSVDLKGGAITSTNAGKSELTTNAISISNLANQMTYSASTASLSGGFSGGNSSGQTQSTSQQMSGIGQQLGGNLSSKGATANFAPSLPMNESGKDASTTYGTLTEGNITIGGKKTAAADLGAHTDAATAHTALQQLPDLKKLLEDQKAMAAAAGTVIATSQQIGKDIAAKAEQNKQSAKSAVDMANSAIDQAQAVLNNPSSSAADKAQAQTIIGNATAYRDSAQSALNSATESQSHWGAGGDYSRALSVVTGIVVGGVAGQGGGQIAANAVAPYAAELIGNQFDHTDNPNKTAQILSHAVLGAALAYANGGSAAGGAIAGGGGEAAAQYLTKELYPQAFDENGVLHRDRLTEAQANNIVALTTGIGALVGGAAGGSIYDGAVGADVAQNAVENNWLSRSDALKKAIISKRTATTGEENKLNAEALRLLNEKDAANDKRLNDACSNRNSSACKRELQSALAALSNYSANETNPVIIAEQQQLKALINKYIDTNGMVKGIVKTMVVVNSAKNSRDQEQRVSLAHNLGVAAKGVGSAAKDMAVETGLAMLDGLSASASDRPSRSEPLSQTKQHIDDVGVWQATKDNVSGVIGTPGRFFDALSSGDPYTIGYEGFNTGMLGYSVAKGGVGVYKYTTKPNFALGDAAINQAKIENNISADAAGLGTSAVRDFEPGTIHRAENINAGQVTDRDGLQRIDNMQSENNNQVAANLGLDRAPFWATQRPAWMEGTMVTDSIVEQPRTTTMTINAQQLATMQKLVENGGNPASVLGAWATDSTIKTVADVRAKVAVPVEWKSGDLYQVEFTIKPGVGIREGTVGDMWSTTTNERLPGGGHQIQFLQNTPRTNPELFSVNLNSIRPLK